jgi:mono/diheme cytochrome c family protein
MTISASLLLVVLLLVPGASAWAQSTAPGTAAPAALIPDWDVVARKGCARCHRVRGIGDGSVGPDLGRLDSGTGFFEIGAAMWNHVPRMREAMLEQRVEWPRLTPQELANVIALLFTAQVPEARGNPAAGASLFVSRGCDRCHPAAGQGRPAAPSARALGRSLSPVLMVAAMWNHGPQMRDAMEAAGVARLTLNGPQMPDLVAYLRTVSRDTAPIVAGLAERGRQVFASKGCVQCHAVGGTGSARGPSLGPRATRPTLTELAGRIWNHGRAVRPDVTGPGISVSRLTGQEAADIVAHLHASYYFDAAEGDRSRGRRLVQDKGCLQCHSLSGKGGGVAPDLATSNVVSTQTGQLTAMWNHGRHMYNLTRQQAGTIPTLTGQELSDITQYLAGLGSVVPGR